jgi:hypothetical protein
MKKLILIIAAVSFSHSITFSQACLQEGLCFHIQAEIDGFQINYPYCTKIEGRAVRWGRSNDIPILRPEINIVQLVTDQWRVSTLEYSKPAGRHLLLSVTAWR